MVITKLIKDIKAIPLRNENENSLRELISKIGEKAYFLTHLDPECEIIRGRVNVGDEKFSKDSDLSFKPERLNNSYQRASTPNKTMFYGCYQPSPKETISRVTSFLEASSWIRSGDKTSIGRQKITFGKWIVKEKLSLLSVFVNPTLSTSLYNEHLYNTYLALVRNKLSQDQVKQSIELLEFLGEEFRKNVINEFDYMISAIFTEKAMNNDEIDGIIYPSVKADFTGYNIAIRPESMHKLELRAVGENMIYKKGEKLNLGNGILDNYAQSDKHMSTFNIQPYLETSEGSSAICFDFGIESTDELPLILR